MISESVRTNLKIAFLGVSENCDFEIVGCSLGLVDIIVGVFGAQLRKSDG